MSEDYNAHLKHVAEPADPIERSEADRIGVEDYEALWFADHLRDYAHYGDDPNTGIALAYAEYIEKQVRDLGQEFLHLYVHTNEALDTIQNALHHTLEQNWEDRWYPTSIHMRIENEAHGLRSQQEQGGADSAVTHVEGDVTGTVATLEEEGLDAALEEAGAEDIIEELGDTKDSENE